MATHSSILGWRIPGTEEPGGLQSMGSQRVRHALKDNKSCPLVPRAPGRMEGGSSAGSYPTPLGESSRPPGWCPHTEVCVPGLGQEQQKGPQEHGPGRGCQPGGDGGQG